MLTLKKISKYLFFLVLIFFFTFCSAERKNPYYAKRARASETNASKLGRNKYYFSDSYQKKLYRSYKRK